MIELLEREELLAQLEAARVEGGRLVFVGGEAGAAAAELGLLDGDPGRASADRALPASRDP